jgi:hypothetical protein
MFFSARLLLGGMAVIFAALQTACSNGAASSFNVDQSSQNFGQKILYNNKVDIVWIVDNSSSMQQHQTRLSQQIPILVSALQNLKMDYHMVAITTSMGADGTGGQFLGAPAVLTSTTPNLQSLLASRILQGETGSNLERGFLSLETALSPAYLANQGAGFLREDALLTVINLSDEDDKSTESAATIANFLDKLKPAVTSGRKSWIFNFIGVLDSSSQCRTFNDYSEPGLKMMQLVDISGGTKESICSSNLAGAVSNIKARIVQILTDFYLADQPIEATIRVVVNGQLIEKSTTNGWSYFQDGSKFVVRFNGTAIPPADADIHITYTATEAH